MKVHVQEGCPDILKFVFRETADEHPGADTDDGIRTRSDSRTRASSATIAVATAVAKSNGEEHDASDSPNRVRNQGHAL